MASKASSGGGNWVTINGVHVLIGANGKITKGPAKFIGSTVNDLPGSSATGKYAKKAAEKKSSTTTKKETVKKETGKKAVTKATTGDKKYTKTAEKFKVDGKEYTYKKDTDGTGYITYKYDNGHDVMFGFNKAYSDAKVAKQAVKDQNARMTKIEQTRKKAQEVGGIDLSTGKIIKPGSVVKTGVDKNHIVQYSAVDAVTGKTIKLDSADMGSLLIKGMDAHTNNAIKNFSNATTTNTKTVPTKKATTTKKTTGTTAKKTTTKKETTKKSSTPKSTGASKDVAKLKTDSNGTAVNTTGKTIVATFADGKTATYEPGATIYNAKALAKYGNVSYKTTGSAPKSTTTKTTTTKKSPSNARVRRGIARGRY